DYPALQLWSGAASREVSAEHVVDLGARGLPERGSVVFSAAARDSRAPDPPNVGHAGPLRFRLVSAHELLAALLLQQQDLRRDLEEEMQRQQALKRRLEAGSYDGVEKAERDAADALARTAAAYADLLAQMLHNRVLGAAAHESRLGGIVKPLEALAASDGALYHAVEAAAVDGLPSRAAALIAEAVAEMERVRARMMLVEGYAAVVASVQEIAGQQRELLRRTGEQQEHLLDLLMGE
ncbi:MAG: hypothetical protein ACYS1C_12655, partial [Planctomycetota bacterium]